MAYKMRQLLAAAVLAVLLIPAAQAQAPSQVPPAVDDGVPVAPSVSVPASGPGGAATSAAQPLPQPGETNAQRNRSQPLNNAPFWRGVRESGFNPGTVNNMQGGERGVLIQKFNEYPGTNLASAGETWRQLRNRWLLPYGGALLVITCLALGLFYWTKGPITVHAPPTGRFIERFTYFERAAHWVNAIAFVILAVSGIFIAFGKYFILPIFGGLLFGWLTYVLKTLHNFVGPAFAVSLVVMFFAYLRDNWPRWDDVRWLMKGGGFFTGEHVPSHRFNAGEKIVFWGGVLFLGSTVVASGLVFDKLVPGLDYTRGLMQGAHIVHAIATVLMMAMITAHIYLGTVGMEGAYRAMRDGYVDESWAREHHEYWYQDIKAGRIPAQRTPLAHPPEQPAPQH